MFRKLIVFLFIFTGMAESQILTFRENNLTVHVGDDIPPLTWTNTGFAGTDTWRDAVVAGGIPSQSTTYTPLSVVGTYPITITQGTMVAQAGYSFAFVNGTITVEPATGMGAPPVRVPRQPAGMMQSMTVANSDCPAAVGDGFTDDTAAINCFLSAGRPTNSTFGRTPKQFYLPGGTVANPKVYLVSGQILAVGSAIAVTGDGWNKTIIKLAAASAGYTSTNQFIFYEGAFAQGANNNGYNEHFENIGVEVGPGNPGTRGLEFIGNNFDAVRNVRVWFDDSKGESAFSVDSPYPGQTLFKNIAGYGGSYCFKATAEPKYHSIIYNMTCENQTIAGVITGEYNVAASNYFSANTVPAWTNNASVIELIGGELIGGGAGQSALTNGAEGTFYARNITTAGYTNSIVDANGGVTLTAGFSEHWSGNPQTLFSSRSPTGIIISPVLETPAPNDPSPDTWCALGPNPTTWSATLAACPSTTAYVPVACNYPNNTADCSQRATHSGYYSPTTLGNINVVVPANINHILGNNYTTAGATINYIISADAADPIILDHFNSTINQPILIHNSARTVVFEDSGLSYSCSPGAGTVYFEDVEIGITHFCPGQSIFARALDNEAEGQILAVSNVAYVSATQTLTLSLNIDPSMVVGSYIYFVGIRPATWLSNSAALVTNISGSTVTARWFKTNSDYPATVQTSGNYRLQLDKVTCNGCNLWSLGWKSEHANTDFTLANSKLEVDGFNQYPVRESPPGWQGFKLINTNAFLTGESYYIGGNQRQYFVTETRLGNTLNLVNPAYETHNNSTLNMFFSLDAPVPTDIGLSVSPNPATAGQNVTLIATAVSNLPNKVPAGVVTFSDEATILGTAPLIAGVASFSINSLKVGSHQLHATLASSSTYAASASAVVTEVINDLNFSLSVSSDSLTIPSGGYQKVSITLTPIGEFSRSVHLACSALPDHARCIFDPATSDPLSNGVQTITLLISTSDILGDGREIGKSTRVKELSPDNGAPMIALLLPFAAFCFLKSGLSSRSTLFGQCLILISITAGLGLFLIGCSGKLPGTTPPGNYVITLTATDVDVTSSLARQAYISLHVPK